MHGDAKGIEVAIFDYRYTTGGGKSSHTWSQTVICFWSEMLKLPEFSMRPEHVFDKIGSFLGFQDIDFPRYPTFSKKYLLKGSDEEVIRAVFNESVLAFCEGILGLSTEGAGTCLVYYRSRKKVKPPEIMGFMEDGFRVFELFASGRPKVP
ncbi:MAG: hypothetical protein QGI33_01860 [Candidatus Brocadiia bacterium]|nr:hypothetical protein [Candidatus Brocadiia bacterium]